MELPLPDYDQLPLNELRHRIRALDEGQLRRLFEHEEAHGHPGVGAVACAAEGTDARRRAIAGRSGEDTGCRSDAARLAGQGVDGCRARHAAAPRGRGADPTAGTPLVVL